jgi:pilus assembly protein CpaB
MKMRWSIIGLVGLGLFAALCAAVLVSVLRIDGYGTHSPEARDEVAIVVAVKALPAMAVVRSGDVATRAVLRSEAPQGYVPGLPRVIGKALLRPMVEGQPFTEACFVSEGSGAQVAAALPEGMRAVSLSLPEQSGLESVLYPGAVVDVMVSFNSMPGSSEAAGNAVATTLIQKVQVLGVEHETVFTTEGRDKTGQPATVRKGERRLVTLRVDPAQARSLQLAVDHGIISLAMRNPLDQGVVEPKPALISDLFKNFVPEPAVVGMVPMPVPGAPSPVLVRPSVPGSQAPPPQAKAEPPAPKWDVIIIRGGSRETTSFDLNTGKPAAPPRQPEP